MDKEYSVHCIACGSKDDLCMKAHRNKKGEMVGWVFACSGCEESLSNLELEIRAQQEIKEAEQTGAQLAKCKMPSRQEWLMWALEPANGFRTHEEIYDYFARHIAH